MDSFYVYVLRRPDSRPFYVGKGKGSRIFNHANEATHPNDRRSNAHKLNVIRAIWRAGGDILYEIASLHVDEADAYDAEEAMIARFGRLHEGGPLTNRASGGGSLGGVSPFSRERHEATLGGIPQDDPETAILNRFVLDIAAMRSVVLKPLSRFTPRPTRKFERSTRKPSLRQAAALAAAASSYGIVLFGHVQIPRAVVIDGVDAFVENGVARDIVTSGLATVAETDTPLHETFVMAPQDCTCVLELIGHAKAEALGLMPDFSSPTTEEFEAPRLQGHS